MTVTIEGYSVVAKKELIADLLEQGKVNPPNGKHIADDHLWRCCFMAESDAFNFIRELEKADLNTTLGPDPDAVVVSEFSQDVEPYCEWLQMTTWEKAVLGWKVGSDPKKLIVHEGFDPKIGSGLTFHNNADTDDLEFLRLEGNVEVYFDKKLGQEVYIGRTTTPVAATFKSAARTIQDHFRTAGEPKLEGREAAEVANAVEQLGSLLKNNNAWWQAYFFHGKGLIALHEYQRALQSLEHAFEIEKNVEAIPRELSGVCLELGQFHKSAKISEYAASLKPDDPESLGNLALNYLMVARLDAARKTIDSALKIDPDDEVNQTVSQMISDVETGRRPQPRTMAELQEPPMAKKRFWEFWKK